MADAGADQNTFHSTGQAWLNLEFIDQKLFKFDWLIDL